MAHTDTFEAPSAFQLLDHADTVRCSIAPRTSQKRKSELGQFMTPSSVARFMAAVFPPSTLHTCRLLDAGAGVGALSCAFLDRWRAGGFTFGQVEATAYEIDPGLRAHLEAVLQSYAASGPLSYLVIEGDFIERVTSKSPQDRGSFTHAILNPPYKKINSASSHRQALRLVGIETVNLYSAFVALAVALMAPGGQVVAIVPRSFCNGPYYKPFRDFILSRSALRHMHLFASRSKAFKDDDVLQENVIILLERSGQQGEVTVSTSTDDTFSDIETNTHSFERIVFPDDPERFIHVPTSTGLGVIELSAAIRYSLADIGVSVSTGPVVEFRMKEYLRDMPEPGSVPLLYPAHFSATRTEWPKKGLKKPNAIVVNQDTERWLYPNGFYCVVPRFSSKEERRRITASLVDPSAFGDVPAIGLENHLNVFHEGRQGLPEALARGLSVFLNTTAVDEHFRRFNGHTQVNATDLKGMKYPSRAALVSLGKWATGRTELSQAQIDKQLEKLSA
jgi:tRNA1(Val) A37 N6-methylase TrmN6